MKQNRSEQVRARLLEAAAQTPAFLALAEQIRAGGWLQCTGVPSAVAPFLARLLQRTWPSRTLLLVVEGLKAQEAMHQDLQTWFSLVPAQEERSLFFFPSWEILPHESRLPHADVISERLETLVALDTAPQAGRVINANVVALLQRTFTPEAMREHTRTLRQGQRLDPQELATWLEEQGYEPEAQVTHKGEFSLRGGILDLFPLISPWPVRLEFFGDELESLRYFDPATQISRETITSVVIPPGGELGLLKRAQNSAIQQGAPPAVPLATLLDHLPQDSLVLLCEPPVLETHAESYLQQVPEGDPFFVSWQQWLSSLRQRGLVTLELEEELLVLDPDTPAVPIGFTSLDLVRPLAQHAPEQAVAEAQRREFFAQIHRWVRQGYTVNVFCNNDGERQRFLEIWQEYGFEEKPVLEEKAGPRQTGPGLYLFLGALSRGFILDAARLVVVTDAEIFGRYKVQRPRRLKSPHAAATRSALDINFAEFEEGDFVVHVQYGIGRYLGLKRLPASLGKKGQDTTATPAAEGQECLSIEYAPNAAGEEAPKLYVPVTEAHLVSKYVGAGKARPQLNTLSGTRWTKAKAQAEKAVRDVAGELLSIQAARASQAGHPFPVDTPWQREFESAFIYEETPDQLKAIDTAKADMEKPRPMDRLICGDVGFGKTEVAIRAAFKAVMGGKQVAILVPTTVLAQQHFNNFTERMADYPVRVELLSRFRTRREQQQALRNLAIGQVDIVIGTHRLVQEDVVFKDLGLVVIDEEQRFGVMHKEKFKRLRQLVDVLTLSATPIPRTLYLALTGARDMSTIETPPQDRLPVETIVTQYDERLIRDAIMRELNRQGQVYFLHNRVLDIHAVAQRLQALVPQARILVGHGQMEADELERVMTSFINGEADVLLSTTIIESGIDIPNANTIIIDRADRFGLSDLYQLRGRVGRYKHQAYAYLLLPRHAGLLADARKRLTAIKQYSTLGSGFKIAMRDLEIRGAGNLLGSEQSGHITAVGFELYCQLLQQSVQALQGQPVKPRVAVQTRIDFLALNPEEEQAPEPKVKRKSEPGFVVNVPREGMTYHSRAGASSAPSAPPRPRAPAYIPLGYIAQAQHRIDIYRKLAQATDRVALEGLREELRDRFGPVPPSVELLLQVGELKLLASARDITVIEVREDKLMLTRHNDYIMIAGKFPRLAKKEASARLKEIKRLLLALGGAEAGPPFFSGQR